MRAYITRAKDVPVGSLAAMTTERDVAEDIVRAAADPAGAPTPMVAAEKVWQPYLFGLMTAAVLKHAIDTGQGDAWAVVLVDPTADGGFD